MNGTQSDVITLNECSSRDPLYLVVGHVHCGQIQLFEHLALHLPDHVAGHVDRVGEPHAGEHLPVQFGEKIVSQIYSSDPESEVPIYHPPQITQDIPAKTGGNVTFAFNWRKYSTTKAPCNLLCPKQKGCMKLGGNR